MQNKRALLRRRRLLMLSSIPLVLPARAATSALLTVTGTGVSPAASGGRVAFDLPALRALPQRTIVTATPWYSGAVEFTGPLLRDVVKAAGASLGGGMLRCTALNDYRVEIPAEDVRLYDVVVAHLLNGKPMAVREKGPLFVIYPFDEQPQLRTTTYFSRCIWQLKAIEVV